MLPVPIRYPLDKTGLSPDNKIVGEPHTLVNRQVRAVAPLYGPFFTESLVVRDLTTGQTLTYGTQYIATEMDTAPTGFYGKEICGIILIKDTSVSSQIEIDYQCLGGQYSLNSDAIVAMLNSAAFDNRPVAWGDIISKPDQFEPADHFHDAGDIYGFEYVVTALERLRSAILIGDSASHDEIYRYIDNWGNQLDTRITTVSTTMNAHIANQNNPHNTTKAQVGLGNVDNFLTATQSQAEAGTAANAFMTPQRTAQAISFQALTPLNAHIQNLNNPHQTTKAQVGLGSVNNFDIATLLEAQQGTSNVKYMTPYLTAQAITVQAGALLQAHINDTNNPHQTTKAQVGLSNVLNYGVATTADAQSGQSNTLYMTPARTADAITYQVGNTLTAHINNLSNPHQTTKAQVGLSNVDNFPTSTQPQAVAGTDNASFMTPLRVAQAIGVQGAALVNAHASRTDNPHSTTKAQVGLGNVDNFATASTADAQAGTRADVFMTPARVREAISTFSAPAWYQGWVGPPGWDANALPGSRSGFTYSYNAPYNGPLVHFDAGGYGLQLNSAYNGQGLAYRARNGDGNVWNGWKVVAHSDGSNAGGTWPINITGSAAAANTATSANTANYSGILSYQGVVTQPSGTLTQGGTFQGAYNNGYPTSYGNVLSLQGGGGSQLLLGWSGTTGAHANNYVRSLRDTGNTWSPWALLLTDVNFAAYALPITGGTVTGNLTVNGTTNLADLNVNGLARTGGWWRSTGQSGWYNETYAGGLYMTQAGYIDGYGGVAMRVVDTYTTSDRRIKTNIEVVRDARKRLFSTVNGCTFDKNGVPSMGLIAQEVQEEFSVAVIETNEQLPDGSKILTVNYNSMLAPMVEAMKETDSDLMDLKQKFDAKCKDFDDLKSKFDALVAKLGIEM